MTTQKKLKASVRARMDQTGESYMVARRHILNRLSSDQHVLRGGIHPDTRPASAWPSRDSNHQHRHFRAMILGWAGPWGGYIPVAV